MDFIRLGRTISQRGEKPGCDRRRSSRIVVAPFPLPPEENIGLWQFSFNRLPELPEILTVGRERELFDWLFQHKAAHPERISNEHRDRYVVSYAKPGAMSRGFSYYRDMPRSASQNLEFSKRKLSMPILALGGDRGMGEMLKQLMKGLGDSVDGGSSTGFRLPKKFRD
jgi:hypothetical protein